MFVYYYDMYYNYYGQLRTQFTVVIINLEISKKQAIVELNYDNIYN